MQYNRKKNLYVLSSIIGVLIIWFLFFKETEPKIYKVYDTFEGVEDTEKNSKENKLIPGSIEEKVAITQQILGGYEGLE